MKSLTVHVELQYTFEVEDAKEAIARAEAALAAGLPADSSHWYVTDESGEEVEDELPI